MKSEKKVLKSYIWIFSLLILSQLNAQISEGGTPKSFSEKSLSLEIPIYHSPIPKIEDLLAEDLALEDSIGNLPHRYGVVLDLNINIYESGQWEQVGIEGRLWRYKIIAPGAKSLELQYSDFWIPNGAKLFLYNNNKKYIIGAFTSRNNKENGKFGTGPVPGDTTIIEYFEPIEMQGQGVINISGMVYGYREIEGINGIWYGDSHPDNININCPEGNNWQAEKRGIVRITMGGYDCSGTLINNTNNDGTPYVLTADHCLDGDPSESWYNFNYESPSCENEEPFDRMQSVYGATVVSNWGKSDFALLKLSTMPPRDYEPYYNGWSRDTTPAENTVCIHHPRHDIKKISIDDDPAQSNNGFIPGIWYWHPANYLWRINIDHGKIEPASSGSPLFDQNHKIVGQAAILNSLTGIAYYGKIDKSWEGGIEPSKRLKDWLDPNNSGAMSVGGLDPYAINPLYINITKPYPTVVWIAGSDAQINWTTNAEGNVAITLWENSEFVQNISSLEPNNGSYIWPIPADLSGSEKYQVKVTGTLPNVIEGQSGFFTIIPKRDEYIDLSEPDAGDIWYKGDQGVIYWSSNKGGLVSIELFKGGTINRTLEYFYPNDNNNSYSYLIPPELTNGSDYKIKITSTSDINLHDENSNFTITNKPFTAQELIVNDNPYFDTINPANDEDWFSFRTMLSGTYVIETYGTTDTYMHLYESDASTLVDNNNDSGTNSNARIATVLEENTLYYVLIHENSYNATGDYNIDVKSLNADYPRILLDIDSFTYNSVQGVPLPSPQSFVITNDGDGVLNWNINENLTWLRTDKLSKVDNHEVITCYITENNLPTGIYTGSLEITSTNADNSPQYVNVSYKVIGECLDGEIIYNNSAGKFNFCENGQWLEKGTCQTIGIPTLQSPSDEENNVSNFLTFDWNDVSNANIYLLALDGNDQFVSPDLQLTTLSEFDAVDLHYSTTYYWRVKANDKCGGDVWSASRKFTTEPPTKIVNFVDPNLEAAIRTKIGKPTGDLTSSDCKQLTYLNANNLGISDLTGLEFCTNLEELHLNDNSISDVIPISYLVSLEELSLENNNLTDISTLVGLTNLLELHVDDNSISNMSTLSTLSNLWELTFENNNVTDISFINTITGLVILDFDNNNVSNISALAGINGRPEEHNSIELYMQNNQIIDIYPLTQNVVLNSDEDSYYITLQGNPLSDTSINVYIPQLRNNGCNVSY